MKILFLTTILLSQRRNGGEVSTQCFIDALNENGHHVTVLGYLRKGDYLENQTHNTHIVSERVTETSSSKLDTIFWLFKSFLINLPYSSVKFYSKKYVQMVEHFLSTEDYDIVVIDQPQLSWLEPLVSRKKRIAMIAHNVEHQIYEELARKTKKTLLKFIYKREARLIKVQEDRLANTVSQIWAYTEDDANYFLSLGGSSKILTFGHSPETKKTFGVLIPKTFDIGLIGSWSWSANIEALEWFIEKIYPHIPSNLSIHIAGKGGNWISNKFSNIYYRGVVPDAQEFLSQARVIAIPTLSGGGIQNKTLDAIASGSQIVATPISLRGISDPPITVSVAETPDEFARLLVRAIENSSEQTSNEAFNWYRERKKKFKQSIHDAICEITEGVFI